MDQGAGLQLAYGTRLGVLPEFWQALDCIWPNTFAGFSTRSREGNCFSILVTQWILRERDREYECIWLFSTPERGMDGVSILGKVWVSCFMLILSQGLKKKGLGHNDSYGTLQPLGILMKNNYIALIVNLQLKFLKIILQLMISPSLQCNIYSSTSLCKRKKKEPYILSSII